MKHPLLALLLTGAPLLAAGFQAGIAAAASRVATFRCDITPPPQAQEMQGLFLPARHVG
jgi:hypothetical protein